MARRDHQKALTLLSFSGKYNFTIIKMLVASLKLSEFGSELVSVLWFGSGVSKEPIISTQSKLTSGRMLLKNL